MSIGQTQAVQGLQQSEAQFDRAAAKIAVPFTSSAGQGDIVDLSAVAVAMMEAKNSFQANIQVLKVDNQMQQSMLSIVG
jgi:flagellar hook-basal body complex protein FliE